jgi:hypothetical protein
VNAAAGGSVARGMLRGMGKRIAIFSLVLAASAGTAYAEKPEVGQLWQWPTGTFKDRDWLESSPSGSDAAGKVVVHWFCRPKLEDCKTDLARIFNMREQSTNVYVIAYINGSKRDATKLDPVRGEVGAGAVAYGKSVAKLVKDLAISGAAMPMSVVVDVDGKVAAITYTGDPDQLDMRDKKVTALVEGIKIFTVETAGPPGTVKKGASFDLSVTAELAAWLEYETSVSPELKLTLPPDVTCDATVLKGDKIKIAAKKLSATVSCKGAVKGSYEAAGALRFRYRGPNKAVGLGEDAVRWKFQIIP